MYGQVPYGVFTACVVFTCVGKRVKDKSFKDSIFILSHIVLCPSVSIESYDRFDG